MADPATWALIGSTAKTAAVGKAAATGAAGVGTAATAGLFGAGGSLSLLKTAGTLSKVGSALNMVSQGQAQSDVADFQVKQEQIRARDESISRRERLIEALAQQNARVGASGVKTVGTPTSLMQTDIGRFEDEQLTADVGSGNLQNQIKAQGRTAKRSGTLGAGISLLSAGTDIGRIG